MTPSSSRRRSRTVRPSRFQMSANKWSTVTAKYSPGKIGDLPPGVDPTHGFEAAGVAVVLPAGRSWRLLVRYAETVGEVGQGELGSMAGRPRASRRARSRGRGPSPPARGRARRSAAAPSSAASAAVVGRTMTALGTAGDRIAVPDHRGELADVDPGRFGQPRCLGRAAYPT